MLPPIVLDFEAHAIEGRPAYPPEPVGLAVWDMASPESDSFYMAWDHPAANNATRDDAHRVLRWAWDSGRPLLFHHAKFDLAVCYEKFGLPHLPWDRVDDTMFLAYLYNPHARRLDLKGLAEDLLGDPPEERDALHDWIWDHRAELRSTYGLAINSRSGLGAHIAYTPGDICGAYAIGDVTRTGRLFEALLPAVLADGMRAAYDRERQLLPILMENEEVGMRVDLEALETELIVYGAAFEQTEDWLRHTLQASGLNFDADADVASVLLARGVVPEEGWPRTPTGQLSMAKDVLRPDMFTDPRIAAALGYRNRVSTCLKMFMQPWAAQARLRGGYISTNWNQTRGAERGGTRTGRPSTDRPNFLNMSKDFEGRTDGYLHPDFLGACEGPWQEFPKLPLVRKYILPDDGGCFLHRDFSGQEVRVFAHYESGDLMQAYLADAHLDPHDWVRIRVLEATGIELERTRVKNVTFSRLYGGGLGAIERQAKCANRAEAQEISNFHDAALPGRKILVDEITKLARRRIPIRTWGGRLYVTEPPGKDGRSKDYKLINYLCQGSAADITKQSIIDWHSHPKRDRDARFLITVYDENNITAPDEIRVQQMAVLKECMEARRLDVPMLSDAKWGYSWGALNKGEPT